MLKVLSKLLTFQLQFKNSHNDHLDFMSTSYTKARRQSWHADLKVSLTHSRDHTWRNSLWWFTQKEIKSLKNKKNERINMSSHAQRFDMEHPFANTSHGEMGMMCIEISINYDC